MANLEPGTKLTLMPASSLKQQPGLKLYSVFEAFLPDACMLILTPIHKGILYPVALEEVLFIYFTDDNGRYDFQCCVVERVVQDNVHCLRAQFLTEIIHKQRRNDFRVEKSLQGILTVNRMEGDEMFQIESPCLSADISSGGISIYANEYFHPGDLGIITIPGPDGNTSRFNSEVVWVFPSDRPNFTYILGLRFDHDNLDEKERMAKYVFQMQYELLQMRQLR